MKILDSKIKKWGYEISLAAPIVASRPVSLLAEDSWIRFASLFADVFPLRIVVQAFTVNTLTVRMPLTHKVAMVHSNSPFGPPFLRCHSYLIISIQKSQAREG